MSDTSLSAEYTRISDDAMILCKRQDFPRALNVLQRRSVDHRRWRWAFRRVTAGSAHGLEGARGAWMNAGIRELVSNVGEAWLRRELAVDFRCATGSELDASLLPSWSARDLWRHADGFGLPMRYLAQVTELPRAISAPIDTAQVVLDCRRVADAHRAEARSLAEGISLTEELPMSEHLQRMQALAQRDAAARWRALAQRLLTGDGVAPTVL